FLGAHKPEPRPDFVAELRLNLVEVLRHLPVRIDFAGHQRRNDLLMGWAKDPFLFRAVANLEEHVPRSFVAATLLPDVGRLKGWHQQFERSGSIHLFANDLLDFAQRAQAQGHESIEATGKLSDQTGSQ